MCIGRGVGRPSVCLGGLVGRRSLPVPALVASESVLSGLPQSSLLTGTPQFSLHLEPSTAVFRVCCGTVIRGRLVGHVYQSICSFPGSPQQRPRVCVLTGPFGAAQNHNPTRTAVIFSYVDSFIQVLTAKHRMPNLSPVTRSHAHAMRHTVLVAASAARYLPGSSSRSGYLTLAV